ncbi:MAG: helix-hairpin-helix domain-containing protein, partial [Anaerolineae bacterium]
MASPSIDVLGSVSGVGPATLQSFRDAGCRTLADLEGVTIDDLTDIPGVGTATARAILEFLQSPAAGDPVRDYRHADRRTNNPPVGMAGYEPQVRERPQQHYAYDPHL